jgi:hypothetical protein
MTDSLNRGEQIVPHPSHAVPVAFANPSLSQLSNGVKAVAVYSSTIAP